MPIEPLLTFAVALGIPIWLVVEEILHLSRQRAERRVPRPAQPPAKLARPHGATPR